MFRADGKDIVTTYQQLHWRMMPRNTIFLVTDSRTAMSERHKTELTKLKVIVLAGYSLNKNRKFFVNHTGLNLREKCYCTLLFDTCECNNGEFDIIEPYDVHEYTNYANEFTFSGSKSLTNTLKVKRK